MVRLSYMNQIRKTFHIVLGLFLVTFGILGLILPILNGIIPLLIGLILLSFESPYVEYHLKKIAHKTEFTGKWYEKLETWMKKFFSA